MLHFRRVLARVDPAPWAPAFWGGRALDPARLRHCAQRCQRRIRLLRHQPGCSCSGPRPRLAATTQVVTSNLRRELSAHATGRATRHPLARRQVSCGDPGGVQPRGRGTASSTRQSASLDMTLPFVDLQRIFARRDRFAGHTTTGWLVDGLSLDRSCAVFQRDGAVRALRVVFRIRPRCVHSWG